MLFTTSNTSPPFLAFRQCSNGWGGNYDSVDALDRDLKIVAGTENTLTHDESVDTASSKPSALLSVFPIRPRLKNVDRSSAQHLEVTVGDLTVIITDFKEKAKPPPATATSADLHSHSGSGSDNPERKGSRASSPRGEGSSVNGDAH